MKQSDLPNPVADDAPDPDDVDGDTVDATVRIGGERYVGADYDGSRYCAECVNIEYLRLGVEDPYQIPYGGPVPEGSEVDCPGSACDHCHRRIEGMTVLHYDAVCDPWSCPDMTARVRDPDRVRDPVEVAVLERDDGGVKVMLREDFGSHGEAGDESWVPESDVLPAE